MESSRVTTVCHGTHHIHFIMHDNLHYEIHETYSRIQFTDHKINEYTLQEYKIDPVENKLAKYKQKWFKPIRRIEDNIQDVSEVPKIILLQAYLYLYRLPREFNFKALSSNSYELSPMMLPLLERVL
jgi:hypothetical protein